MTKAKQKPPPKEPPLPQAERFKKAARDLEAAGALNLTEAGEAFEAAFKKAVPQRRKPV